MLALVHRFCSIILLSCHHQININLNFANGFEVIGIDNHFVNIG